MGARTRVPRVAGVKGGEEQRDNLFSTALLTLSFGEISFPSHAFHTLDQLSSFLNSHLASFLWLPSGFLPQLP